MAKLNKTKDNLALTAQLLRDPSYHTYTIKKGDKAGQTGGVCNVNTVLAFGGFGKFYFNFVTFNADLAADLAARYRKGDSITVTRSSPFVTKDKNKEGVERDVLKWRIYAYEVNEPEGYGEDSVDVGGEPDDDCPPI